MTILTTEGVELLRSAALRRGAWSDGGEAVCMMGALVRGAAGIQDCRAAGWPGWLAELCVRLYDADVGAPDEQLAADRWALRMAEAIAHPVDYDLVLHDWMARLLRRIEPMDDTGAVGAVIELHERAMTADAPRDHEWTAARNAARNAAADADSDAAGAAAWVAAWAAAADAAVDAAVHAARATAADAAAGAPTAAAAPAARAAARAAAVDAARDDLVAAIEGARARTDRDETWGYDYTDDGRCSAAAIGGAETTWMERRRGGGRRQSQWQLNGIPHTIRRQMTSTRRIAPSASSRSPSTTRPMPVAAGGGAILSSSPGRSQNHGRSWKRPRFHSTSCRGLMPCAAAKRSTRFVRIVTSAVMLTGRLRSECGARPL